MRDIGKKMLAAVIAFGLLVGTISMQVQADAKTVYWLSGVSKAADGHTRMYYKGNTIVLKGKARKSASRDKVYDAAEKKCSYSLRVAGNCKVIFIEAENKETVPYKTWAKGNGYKNGDEFLYICVTLKVEDKKITKIYFSS